MSIESALLAIVGTVVSMLIAFVGVVLRGFVNGAIVTRREHSETRADRDRAIKTAEALVEAIRLQSDSTARLIAVVEESARSQSETQDIVRRMALVIERAPTAEASS